MPSDIEHKAADTVANSANADAIDAVSHTILPEIRELAEKSFIERFMAWIILIVVGGVWGVTFSLAKLATETGAHPLGVSFWQSLIGSGILIIYCLVFRQKIPLNRSNLLFYAVCALTGSAIPNTLYFYAAPNLSAGVLSITVAMVPIMTYVGAAAMRFEKFMIRRIVGVVCGLSAVLLLVSPDDALANPGSVIWVLAALISAACYATENMVVAIAMPSNANSATVLTGMFIFASFVLAPFVVYTDSFVPLAWPWTVVEWSIIAMALISVISYGFFIHLIQIAGPVFASQMAYVVTLSGVFWGVVIYSEEHSHWIWIALAVMMTGLFLVAPKKREEIEDVE